MTNHIKPKRLPLFIQISELLNREIVAGHWLPGERLPTEVELARKLGVAVGTLRKALTQLENEGLVERRQGSGTYVKVASSGDTIYQFFRLELLDGGGIPSADVLSVSKLSSPNIAEKLNLTKLDTPLWRFRRLRKLNQRPVAIEEIWISSEHREHITANELHESLYFHYREEFGFWISRIQDFITLGYVPDWTVDAFPLAEGACCGMVERLGWSNHNVVEEVSLTWFDPKAARYAARWS
ncbi:Mannosyl-D-glycerate transport/metabolism system repressor MngR [Vibrio thalassae]|uniref:Mannosyl-D-glycerate transport/metabolism system repressor MngR n=1 Tax=Vibrio thalassae TaxID=1243014 RepID=A0A240EPR3_9VIBR|nr:GntR family transcriptional regulator [Vibrio thalassae]SNX49995.1 Mannosyl-D-glycerate transport/metabolism system repressor MngR [Vibrio thalassae]